jgi:hypothetical protein
MKQIGDNINDESTLYSKHKEKILSNEIKLRDSIVLKLNDLYKFESLYMKKDEEYQKTIEKIDLVVYNINNVIQYCEEIEKTEYNGKYFSGLIFPLHAQFNLKDVVQLGSEIKTVKAAMNYQSANQLKYSYDKYDSLLNEFNDKMNKILSISVLNFHNIQIPPTDDIYVMSIKSVHEDLKHQLKEVDDNKTKLLEIKKGEQIQEKLNILQDHYFVNLGNEIKLSSLVEYNSKMKRLNAKLKEILNSEDRIKELLKESKNEENAQQIEIIFLK